MLQFDLNYPTIIIIIEKNTKNSFGHQISLNPFITNSD
jgi:hypothetical protein